MKKTFLFSLVACLGFVNDGFSAACNECNSPNYNCNVQEISALSFKKSNEFLFTNDSAHDHANGMALVCGHRTTNGCAGGAIVVVGANHVWENKKRSALNAYSCATNGANAWSSIGISDFQQCSKNQKKEWTYFGEANDYTGKMSVYCRTVKSSGNYGRYCYSGGSDDICVDKGCPDCDKVDPTPKPTPKPDPKPDPKPNPKPKPDNKDNCKQYSANPARYACCKQSEAEWICNNRCACKTHAYSFIHGIWKWTNSNLSGGQCIPNIKISEAKACEEDKYGSWDECDGKLQEYDLAGSPIMSGICVCEGGRKWVYDSTTKTGKCEEQEVEMSDCYYQFNMTVNCNNGQSYNKDVRYTLTKEQAKELSCRGGNIVEQLSGSSFSGKTGSIWENEIRNIEGMRKLMDLICGSSSTGFVPGGTPNVTPQGPSAAEVKAAADKLSAFAVSAESNRNVWKDAEGKFNTARLASDLTAGVVLGTVGGVVSGVVIKKKQVQKGFEALHCTVGGQTIADWGDDFSVGLR